MNEETRVRSIFLELAREATPPDDGWVRLTSSVRRYHRRRLVVGSMLALLLIAALSFGLTRIANQAPDHFVKPTPSATRTLRGPGTWRSIPSAPLSSRVEPGIAWTGTEMIVWGGNAGEDDPQANGATYDPTTKTWASLPASPLVGLNYPVAVWAGDRLILWGGQNPSEGAAYFPDSRTWRTIARAPIAQVDQQGIWTGTEMFVWGMRSDNRGSLAAALYNPAKNKWQVLDALPPWIARTLKDPYTGSRYVGPVMVWTGRDIIATTSKAAAQYDPQSGSWTALPAPRLEDPAPWLVGPVTTAVWTGDRLLMWAERSSGFGLTGAAYDPGTRTWSSIASYSHCATQACNSLPQTAPQNGVWTGSLLIDVNGFPGAVAYDPARNSWRVLTTPYFGGEAVWTGHSLIVLGSCLTDCTDPHVTRGEELTFEP